MDCVKYMYISDVLNDVRENGTVPLFRFAVDDYIAKYDLDQGFLKEYGGRIFGAVLYNSDFTVQGNTGWTAITAIIFDLTEWVDMVVLDIKNVSKENVEALKKYFSIHLPCYAELEGVYEDRIVFVAHHIKERVEYLDLEDDDE